MLKGVSKQLLDTVPKLKAGEVVKFELTGIYYDPIMQKTVIPTSKQVPEIDKIWDPWAIEDGATGVGKNRKIKYRGDMVDIAYILKEYPSKPGSDKATQVELGQIRFFRNDFGRIQILGGNKTHEMLYYYLSLTNYNGSNLGKEGHVVPMGGCIFKRLEPKKIAADELDRDRTIKNAQVAIDKMSVDERRNLIMGLFPAIEHKWDDHEVTGQLYKIAKKNPEKILNLSKDVSVRVISFIKKCERQKLIKVADNQKEWGWGDNTGRICFIKPGRTPEESLQQFFMTEDGRDVLETLETLMGVADAPVANEGEKTKETGEVPVSDINP